MSIIPTAIVAGVWYHLARQGVVTQTVWLGLNILDSLRALRTAYPNGRNVGVKTRRRAMREAMLCWTAYVAIQQFGGIPDRLLGWLPLYPLIRTIFVSTFLVARRTFSEALYTSFIHPTLKHYENQIDLTLLLLESIASLVFYFTIHIPFTAIHSFSRRHVGGIFLFGVLAKPTQSDGDTTDVSLGSIVEGLDQDATTISAQDFPPIRASGNPGSVRRQTKKLEYQMKKATPAVVMHPSATKSKVTGVRPISPYTAHFKQLASIPKVVDVVKPHGAKDHLNPVTQVSLRSKRSPAPTPELPLVESATDVFGQPSDKASASAEHVVVPAATVTVGTKRKHPISSSSTTIAPRRRMLESTSSLPVPLDKVKPNPLSQPPRRLPSARDANVPRPRLTVPHALGKSKSTLELGSAKKSNAPVSTLPTRPTKSAPTRRPPPAVLADHSTTKTMDVGASVPKRIPSAADRAKVIRDAKRREEAVDVGEKRKSVRSIGPEGSKRAKVHIVRD